MKLRHMLLAAAPLLAGGAALIPAPADASPFEASAAHPYAPHVTAAAQRFGIPPDWIWHVMRAESRGKPRAVSPAGAIGLMQIMPATWAMLSARYRLGSDPYDIRANIHGGAAYLRMMWDRYGDMKLMLAAYNAGPGRTDAYVAGRRRLPAETTAYVAAIAPAIGTSSAVSRTAAPPAKPHTWRSASVFALPAPRTTKDSEAGIETSQQRSSFAQPETTSLSPERSPHALFVRVSTGEE